MLDNVSTQDFNGDSADDIQRQVQDALTQNEMKKMEIVEPSTALSTSSASTFMASPAPPAPAASPTATVAAVEDSSAPAQEPFNVASLETPKVEMPPTSDVDGSVPRPLTPEEDKQAVIDAENTPTPSIVVSAPLESSSADVTDSASQTDGSTNVGNASDADSSLPVVNPDSSTADAASPSAPVEPPAAPPPLPEPIIEEVPDAEPADASADEESAKEETEEPSSEESTSSESEDVPSELPAPLQEPSADATDTQDATTSDSDEDTEEALPTEDEAPSPLNSTGIPAVDTSKLAALKQHALDHLEPLADQLDQSPEEEFRTTMMRIQANDNHTLLEKALNAAKKIEDGSARAKALLDIINEINYFAQTSEELS